MLEDLYLKNISGGGYTFLAVIAGIVTFIAGVIDGYVRPLKCN